MAEKKEEEGKNKPKIVKVDAGKLEEILTEFADLKRRLERTESAADLSRLSVYDSKNQKIGPRIYKVSTYTNPKTDKVMLIMSWRTVKNVSVKETTSGTLIENQEYELKLEDGSLVSVNGYKNFSDIRYSGQVIGEEVEYKKNSLGATLVLSLKGGKKIEIDERFVN